MRLLTIVTQILRRCPMKRLVDQQADLELDSKGNWEPVYSTSRRSGVTWSYFLLLHSSLAAALRTDCRQSRRYLGAPTSRLLLKCDEGCNCRSHSLERQRFDAAFEKTKLAETATDSSSHMVFHRQIRLKHDAKVTSNSHRTNQGTTDTELPGVKMGTPSAGRAPKKLRLLRIKTESVRSHPLRYLLNSQLHPAPLQSIR